MYFLFNSPGGVARKVLSVEQQVNGIAAARQMPALYDDVLRPKIPDYARGFFGVFDILYPDPGERLRLGYVRHDNERKREKLGLQPLQGVFFKKPFSARGDDNGIDDEFVQPVAPYGPGDCGHRPGGIEHPGLDGVRAYV